MKLFLVGIYLFPFFIKPSTNNMMITSYYSASVVLKCRLSENFTSSVTIMWSHDGNDVMSTSNNILHSADTTILRLSDLQPSDAGVYQCVFNDTINGWVLRRNIVLNIRK